MADAQSAVFKLCLGVRIALLARLRRTRRHWRRRCRAISAEEQRLQAGTTTSMMIGPISIPPTTTVASGRCTWLPMPVDTAAGNRPMQAESAVISIGRIRCSAAWNMASIGAHAGGSDLDCNRS